MTNYNTYTAEANGFSEPFVLILRYELDGSSYLRAQWFLIDGRENSLVCSGQLKLNAKDNHGKVALGTSFIIDEALIVAKHRLFDYLKVKEINQNHVIFNELESDAAKITLQHLIVKKANVAPVLNEIYRKLQDECLDGDLLRDVKEIIERNPYSLDILIL